MSIWAFAYIKKLWSYNTYEETEIREVYERVIRNPESFAFFALQDGEYKGFCHGDYFDTFWMSGLTCYVSSLITNEDSRGKGFGVTLIKHAEALARERGCKAIILDSGFSRKQAHHFYETYGFEKSCYGFESCRYRSSLPLCLCRLILFPAL